MFLLTSMPDIVAPPLVVRCGITSPTILVHILVGAGCTFGKNAGVLK